MPQNRITLKEVPWLPIAMLKGYDNRRFGRYPGNVDSTASS
jgi:hypothetical protein